jgi:mannitol/fructose-specific phosphotransferase system IIA component (Ntr-type)
MALIDLIDEQVVRVPLTSDTKEGVMRELVGVLADAGKVESTDGAVDALMKREGLGSTGLENGIAVPHAKTPEVSSLTVAIGIAPSGIDFDAMDGQPSKLFFLMLAPPDQSGPHIEALAEIARMTQSAAFCRALVSSKTPAEVIELFSD